jgi:hypothetical protein
MSGYSRESLDRETIGLDAGFLAKPFTPAGLAGAVRDVLDGLGPDDGAQVVSTDTDDPADSADTPEPAIA